MPFNTKQFNNTDFSPRTKEVLVEKLKPFFSADETPVFTLRSLNAEELAVCRESAEKAKAIEAVIEGIASPDNKEKADAICKSLGIRTDVPPDLVKRFDTLAFGCVSPKFDRETVIKLAQCYPIQFYVLTNEIMNLTGEGSQPGKLPGSGMTQESETPSSSAE